MGELDRVGFGVSAPLAPSLEPLGDADALHFAPLRSYRKTHAIRHERTTTRGDLATRTLPGYHAQALECLLEIASYLSFRYPELFTVTRAAYDPSRPETYGDSLVGDEGGAVTSIHNRITDERWDFVEIEKRDGPNWNPMYYAGRESLTSIMSWVSVF